MARHSARSRPRGWSRRATFRTTSRRAGWAPLRGLANEVHISSLSCGSRCASTASTWRLRPWTVAFAGRPDPGGRAKFASRRRKSQVGHPRGLSAIVRNVELIFETMCTDSARRRVPLVCSTESVVRDTSGERVRCPYVSILKTKGALEMNGAKVEKTADEACAVKPTAARAPRGCEEREEAACRVVREGCLLEGGLELTL